MSRSAALTVSANFRRIERKARDPADMGIPAMTATVPVSKSRLFPHRPALEWLANLCSHIPNRGEQMVRYYGYYSNVSRGKRQKESSDEAILCILEPQGDEKIFRRNWARWIQKIGACPGEADCVVMSESTINIVIPAQAGIQNLLITLDSVSRFACTE
jgi:hypothetical protein